MSTPKVFISYSWDSIEHQEWVINLANKLRSSGVEANIDKFATQKSTVNLNRMMIDNFRTNDYIIVVMSEKYAEKANENKGGVGFETTLLSNELNNKLDKIILIKRDNSDDDKVIPYMFKGIYYIDFSDNKDFETKFEELIYKIYKQDFYEVCPLGEKPKLKPKKLIKNKEEANNREPNFYIKKQDETQELENGKVYETIFANNRKQRIMIDKDGYHVEFMDEQGRVTYADVDFNGDMKYVKPPISWSEFRMVIPEDKVISKQKYNIPTGYGYIYKFKWSKMLIVEYDFKNQITGFEARVRTEVNYNNKIITVYPDDIETKII